MNGNDKSESGEICQHDYSDCNISGSTPTENKKGPALTSNPDSTDKIKCTVSSLVCYDVSSGSDDGLEINSYSLKEEPIELEEEIEVEPRFLQNDIIVDVLPSGSIEMVNESELATSPQHETSITVGDSEDDSSTSSSSDIRECYRLRAEILSDTSSESSLCWSEDENDKRHFSPKLAITGREKCPPKKSVLLDDGIDLPPIENLQISVKKEEAHPIGVITQIVDCQVVIQAYPNLPAIDLDSVLFLDCGKKALGIVYDVFGPIQEPLYVVRFNSFEHVKEQNVDKGMIVYFAPDTDHTSYVIINDLLGVKGSDASWRDNREPPERHLDYSDDEEERKARQARKQSKIPQDSSNIPNEHESRQKKFKNENGNPFNRRYDDCFLIPQQSSRTFRSTRKPIEDRPNFRESPKFFSDIRYGAPPKIRSAFPLFTPRDEFFHSTPPPSVCSPVASNGCMSVNVSNSSSPSISPHIRSTPSPILNIPPPNLFLASTNENNFPLTTTTPMSFLSTPPPSMQTPPPYNVANPNTIRTPPTLPSTSPQFQINVPPPTLQKPSDDRSSMHVGTVNFQTATDFVQNAVPPPFPQSHSDTPSQRQINLFSQGSLPQSYIDIPPQFHADTPHTHKVVPHSHSGPPQTHACPPHSYAGSSQTYTGPPPAHAGSSQTYTGPPPAHASPSQLHTGFSLLPAGTGPPQTYTSPPQSPGGPPPQSHTGLPQLHTYAIPPPRSHTIPVSLQSHSAPPLPLHISPTTLPLLPHTTPPLPRPLPPPAFHSMPQSVPPPPPPPPPPQLLPPQTAPNKFYNGGSSPFVPRSHPHLPRYIHSHLPSTQSQDTPNLYAQPTNFLPLAHNQNVHASQPPSLLPQPPPYI